MIAQRSRSYQENAHGHDRCRARSRRPAGTHSEPHEHHELGFWRKYVFSTDHKVIGIQYAVTGLLFLFFGFCLMMLMRWQLAFPAARCR